jgi:glycosyltransferase involved in cell wall biosynthesis
MQKLTSTGGPGMGPFSPQAHLLSVPVRVHIVDPAAYTPPYDHALSAALAAEGAAVTLYTSRFPHGAVAAADGYAREELFYRAARLAPGGRSRRSLRLAEHVPDMLRYRRASRAADVVHFQWLPVQQLDGFLLPPRLAPGAGPALVLTAHDILPREARLGQRSAQRRLFDRFDAIVVHSDHGRIRLTEELGVPEGRVHVIPHGALAHLAQPDGPGGGAKPAFDTDKPVVLCFGLIRPYKGIDVLLEAWRGIEDAELWVVGMPRMDISPLLAAAPPGVRFLPRFVGDDELPAYFRRADLVVLPYRDIDQSGVLFTALAFARPLLLSDAGGFPELEASGAARIVPAGDSGALGAALRELLGDPALRRRMGENARVAAAGRYGWRAIARRTLDLYEELLGPRSRA